MADRSIPQEQLKVLQAILKETEGCSSAKVYYLLHKYLPAILDEMNEQTEIATVNLAESQKQTSLLLQLVDALTTAPERTATAAIFFGDNMAATPGTLSVGSTLTATFVGLLADGVTVNTTTKLTTPPTWASSDTSIATVSANADGTATVTGVAAGTATITGTAGSFTDSDGTVVGPLDASNTVSDTAPAQRTVSAQVNFA